VQLALVLFAWLSTQNNRDRTAVFGFKANEYRAEGSPEKPKAVWVGSLTRDEVSDACKKLMDVQDRTDAAVDQVRKAGNYKGPSDFGTKVHKIVADGINAQGDPNYIAEVSVMKSRLEEAYYGKEDTVRVDAFENRPRPKTVCVYDPKTGKAGLSLPRFGELAHTVERVFPGTKRIIVVEVRPGQK
jgi:hypothetical protein